MNSHNLKYSDYLELLNNWQFLMIGVLQKNVLIK